MKLFDLLKRKSKKELTESAEEAPVVSYAPETLTWQDKVPTSDRPIVSKGLLFVFGFLSLFFIWAVAVPISSAVVTVGTVISSGQNKTIQHATGGVVAKILVEDGAKVTKGETLLVLDSSSARAELTRLTARHAVLSALKSRLTAGNNTKPDKKENLVSIGGLKLRGGKSIELPALSDDALSVLEAEQQKELAAARKRLTAELDAVAFQIETLKDEGEGLLARLRGQEDLLEFSNLEIAKIRPLVEDGVIARSRLWELEKKRLEQKSTIGNLKAELAANDQKISEAEAKYERTEANDDEKRSEELTKVIGELAEISDQILSAQTNMKQTELKAPVDGTLVRMIAHTVGGVIKPGDVVAELVPSSAALEVEMKILPSDVDNVHRGQNARVVVTAFNRRTYEPIDAEVTYVSADSTVDQMTGERHFTARARLIADPEKNTGISEITPGMSTEVFVLAQSRVFLSYVMQPVADSINKAFRQ